MLRAFSSIVGRDRPTCSNRVRRVTIRASISALFSLAASIAIAEPLFDAAFLGCDAGQGSVAVGDLNGDSKLDLVNATYHSSSVIVLLGRGDGTFGPKRELETGADPANLTLGDLNGDGKLDLVVAVWGTSRVAVFLGRGDGTFDDRVDLAGGAGPCCPAIGDFNRDGKPDLAVAADDGEEVSVLLGHGDGSFEARAAYPTAVHPSGLVIADFNQDGVLDLAVPNDGSLYPGNYVAYVSVFFGLRDGGFAPRIDIDAGSGPPAIAADDVNRDGLPDLVVAELHSGGEGFLYILLSGRHNNFVAVEGPRIGSHPTSVAICDQNVDTLPDVVVGNSSGAAVSLLLGRGDGTFAPRSLLATSEGPLTVAVGDLNGDGRPDLVAGAKPVSVILSKETHLGSGASFAAGGSPHAVALGDLNSDGNLDVAIADYDSSSVSVLFGRGRGTFDRKIAIAAGLQPRSVAIADLNGDGKLDLAVANESNSTTFQGTVSVLLGRGDGTFAPRIQLDTGLRSYSLAIGDLNEDGKLDLAVANWGSYWGTAWSTVSVLLGHGDGSFQQRTDYRIGLHPIAVAMGDLNGDGSLDLAIAEYAEVGTVSVLQGRGDGTFGGPTDYTAGIRPFSVTIEDLNRDGRLDLAVANAASNLPHGSVSVLLGRGDATFAPQTDLPTGAYSCSVVSGDLDGDGNPDLAVANFQSNTSSVFLGRGDGSFGERIDYGTGRSPAALAIGDLNGDRKPDLAVANSTDNTVSQLLNRRQTTAVLLDGFAIESVNDRVAIRWHTPRLFAAQQFSLRAACDQREYRIAIDASDGHSFTAVDHSPELSQCEGAVRYTLWYRESDSIPWVVLAQQLFSRHDEQAPTALLAAYPNPFQRSIAIPFSVARSGSARIDVYDVAGRRVAALLRGRLAAGRGLVTWDARDALGRSLPTGIYFVRLSTSGESKTVRIVRAR